MKHFLWLIFICFLWSNSIHAQVDRKNSILQSKIFSPETFLGDWVDAENQKFTIKKGKEGELVMRKKGSDWLVLERAGHNAYEAGSAELKLYRIHMLNENELEIFDLTDPDNEVKMIVRRKVDGIVVGDEKNKNVKTPEDKRMFISVYPALNSPIAIYAGRLNKKFNWYGGISISGSQLSGDFFEGQSSGDEYLNSSGDPNNTGVPTGDKVISQATVAVGLSSELISNKLRVHYGLGFGKYEEYYGFDLWERNQDGDWNYVKSVWAKDEPSIVEGLYLEGGLMWDLGVLVSLGVGTISFEQAIIRLGLGYAF